MAKKRDDYLSNADLSALIAAHLAAQGTADRTAETNLVMALYKITTGIVKRWRTTIPDIDDAVQEGVINVLAKVHRFDPDKGSAFNYCSTIVFNHFKQLYRNRLNYVNMIKAYQQEWARKNCQDNGRVEHRNTRDKA